MDAHPAEYRIVTPGYLEALGVVLRPVV